MTMNTENGKRVFVGHITSDQQWDKIKETAEGVGAVEHTTRLFPSKLVGYYFGFIVMETHELAERLIWRIGQEKYDEDYVYNWGGPNARIRVVKYPQTYADWAKVKEPSQIKSFTRRRLPHSSEASKQ